MGGTGEEGVKPPQDGRRRAILIVVAVLAAVLVLAGAVWALTRGGSDEGETAEKPEIEHALPTTPEDGSSETSPSSTPSAPAVPGPGGGGTAGGSGSGTAPGTGTRTRRNPVIPYRLGGALYAAAENGAGAVRVASSASGVFALSPDGRSLAYVDLGTRELVIADVATGATVNAGPAEQTTPVWAPTSEWVLFTRASTGTAAASGVYRTDVLRVGRSQGAPVVLGTGTIAATSADARTIVVADVEDVQPSATYLLKVIRDGRIVKSLAVPGPVSGLATDGTRAFAAVSHMGGSSQAQDGIWTVPLDGSAPTRLVTPAATTRPVETRSLMLSPDGSRLAYVTSGDDGYSRAAVVQVAGGIPLELARRRDAYLLGWSADGSSVFFIEGNAWQGESTALVRSRPDGSGHEVVIEGAGF